MAEERKTLQAVLLIQAEANCKHLKAANISTLFEEYWQRFTFPNSTDLGKVETDLLKQYIQEKKVEYLEALLDTLRSQIELSERQSKEDGIIARRRYESLANIIPYK
jgi:hypothetical protein